MKKILAFVRREIVFCVAFLCALISAFFVHPSLNYINYIDWNTLLILFALMGVVAALRNCGVFGSLGNALCALFHTERSLVLTLVSLCFFSSMFITNDVALLTFVPLTLAMLARRVDGKLILYIILLQTLAANLGSMLTPLGNPQNLFLFQKSEMGIFDFLTILLPYTVLSGAILFGATFFVPKKLVKIKTRNAPYSNTTNSKKWLLVRKILYALIFVLCLLSVLRLVPKYVAALSVFVALLIFDRKILLSIDYMLLLTFIAFFIFTGNIASISIVRTFIEKFIDGNEFFVSILVSQIVSNVPATLLLYPFSENTKSLLVGVNVGGCGTLIASMASLISYRFYANAQKKLELPPCKKYMLLFTIFNAIILLFMIALHVALEIIKKGHLA